MIRYLCSALAALSFILIWSPQTTAFSGPLIDDDPYKRTQIRTTAEWDWGRTWAGWSVNNQPVSSILATVLGTYKFTAPRVSIQRGQAYNGAASRLRRVVRHLMSPTRPMKIGVIGGSITWGQGTRPRGEADWFSLLSKWMITAFPRANITARNGCTPGVPATYMILCLELSVDPDVDLVFIEFTLNNGQDERLYENHIVKDMERLVRRVLGLPSRPAVVLMHVPTHGMADYPKGHPKNPNHEIYFPFYSTSEDALSSVSQYYDVQALSMRSAVYDLAVRQQREGFLWEHMFVDLHPGNQGHKVMADLAVYLLQMTALGLMQVPFTPEDQNSADAELPEPMYAGNLAPNGTMCVVGDRFRSLVNLNRSSGFEYVNEGTAEKPKPGFVATQPGSTLRLVLNTDRSATSDPASNVSVFFHHLRSYEHMGVAGFSCVSGCACDPRLVDGHHKEPASQLYMVQLEVSQHRQCEMEVQVTNLTNSGEHKFKVAGVVVSERAGDAGIMGTLVQGGGHFGVREHNGDVAQIILSKEGRMGGNDAAARRRLTRKQYRQQQRQYRHYEQQDLRQARGEQRR